MSWFVEALKKYAVFSGRSRRKEYWYFVLFAGIIYAALTVIDMTIGTYDPVQGAGVLSSVAILALLIPTIAVSVRRLHDIDRTGQWFLIWFVPLIGPIVLVLWLVRDSTPGSNRYGPNPKAASGTAGTWANAYGTSEGQAVGRHAPHPDDSPAPRAATLQSVTHSYSDNMRRLDNEEHQGNYGEVASVKEIVDLSPQQALDEAQTFLVQQGYRTMQRRGESLTMQRCSVNQTMGQNALNLAVTALHQPEGGVRISVRGNDHQGVHERQAAWVEWAESLPKKQEIPPIEAAGEQLRTEESSYGQGEAAEGNTIVSTTPLKLPDANEPNVYDQIRRLAELRDEGLLTSEEFGAKKQELLARL